MNISIVIPVYNPAEGWADIVWSEIAKIRQSMPGDEVEVIIVNDGSTNAAYRDEKGQIQKYGITLIEYGINKGKGEALRCGVRSASGELVIYTDIDFPYTIESLINVVNILQRDAKNVAIGIKDSHYYDHVPLFRKMVSQLLRLFTRIFFRLPTDDFMCGLKGFDRKGREVFLQTDIDRYLFDLDFMLLISRRSDMSIATVEVKLRENVQFRKMNPGMIRTEVRDLIRLLVRSIPG